MVALIVPVVLALLAAGTLMITAHRQNSANERHEQDALEQMARHVESYEDGVPSYEDTSFFGISTSRTYHCYSFRFQQRAEGGPRRKRLPFQQCNPT
ncbi:hypothetical protein [Streptomyces justiciae]|uniref:Type II secretion system protein n=1 Tax=Streptomyces justiciae TaxID=2780140 RepID=A0ABU3LMT7_9ACTN|nr:hypothetical protein [Streptomyces justiciae]MDT7840161.1 hypothetical protein [Streptomyces justiciae]